MRKKKVLVLLSILHICVFCIGILIILRNTETNHTSILPDSDIHLADSEPETESEIETLIKTEPETAIPPPSEPPTELQTEPQTETQPETQPEPTYTFQYVGGKRNLNIRTGPSMENDIIGKITPNTGGRVIEFANEDWALVEYRGTTGYSSLHWMALTPIDAE